MWLLSDTNNYAVEFFQYFTQKKISVIIGTLQVCLSFLKFMLKE